VLAACYLGGSDPAPAPVPSAPVAAAPDPSLQRIRRLSRREIVTAYADLVGETVPETELLDEALGYDNGPGRLRVGTDQASRLEALAWKLADGAVARREPLLFASCDVDAPPSCRDALIAGLAPRAYRRPLTEAEKQNLVRVWDETQSEGGTVALAAMIAAVLQSPAFLYREELGDAVDPKNEGSLVLRPYEIASALSFLIAGKGPDDELLAAAARGELATGAGRRREAERLLGRADGHRTLVEFLRQWLALDRVPLATKAGAEKLPPGTLAAMDEDSRGVLSDVLSRRGSIRDLLTTRVAFVADPIADLYGTKPGATVPVRIELDAKTRAGVLTRAGFLTVHSAADHSSPVGRGVFVLDAMLCRTPAPPPSGIPRFPPVQAKPTTTRDRFAIHDQDPTCQGCHRAIDGIGFGFEEFDLAGRHRTAENGLPIDASGFLDDEAFVGVTQLEEKLLANDDLLRCFVRQTFRFASGGAETPAISTKLGATFAGASVDTPIEELVLRLVESDLFVVRERAP
jgi:hypothetical protein